MLKSLAVIAIVALFASDSIKKNQSADLAKRDSDNGGTKSTLTVVNNQAPVPKENSADNEPRKWYTRPDVWLCILAVPTLIFVGIQAVAAKDAAKATLKQSEIANKTLIAQFRPRVVVRDVSLLRDNPGWSFRIQIENLGGTNANVKRGDIEIRWRVFSEHRYQVLHKESIRGFPLGAGDEYVGIWTITDEEMFASKINTFSMAFRDGKIGTFTMQAVGTIGYTDDSGMFKKTGFCRNLDIETERFRSLPDSEDEYQD
jgi:hypothetical protein